MSTHQDDVLNQVRADVEAALKHNQRAHELLNGIDNKPIIPQQPVVEVALKSYLTRINAVLFSGKMNKEQRNCVLLFTVALKMAHMAGREVYYQFLAYMLATTYHETGFTMKSIKEWGEGKGHEYGEPHPTTGQRYFGRSYPQLTWYENYLKASKLIYDRNLAQGVDIVNHPDDVLEPFYGVQVTLFGMLDGWFTGKALEDYRLADGSYDYVNARRIINGTDKAYTIAGYAQEIESAILLAMGQEINRATLKLGSKGDDVIELQIDLKINPDGIFGQNTEKALVRYQQENNLESDGVCGTATWRSIERNVYGLQRPE